MSKKLDQRKRNSANTMAKKSKAGQLGKAVGAFVVKRNQTVEDKLKENMDKVVDMAKENGTIANSNGLFFARPTLRVRGSKVG